MNHVLLMMGGSGTRFGADIPKQYIEVDGCPVFAYIVRKYEFFDQANSIVLVCRTEWVDYANEWARRMAPTKYRCAVAGGATRSESVRNGLRCLAEYASDNDVVLIHDATHPYLDETATADAICMAETFGASTLGQKQYDTVYRTDDEGNLIEVLPREEIVSGASPELFTFEAIHRIYENANELDFQRFTSAGAIALANGISMKVVPTDLVNLKITYRRDMELFERLFRGYFFNEAADKEGAAHEGCRSRVAE